MQNQELIITLAVVTLLLVIAIAAWQRFRVGKAKREQHHSATTAGNPQQRHGGGPGVKPPR